MASSPTASSSNPFDQFDAVPVVTASGAVTAGATPAANESNPFDKFDAPEVQAARAAAAAKASAGPVTDVNRAHAAEGGILGGLAYTATSIPDAVANAYNLGKAALGAGYSAVTGKPGWDVGEPFPVGHALTSWMDTNPGGVPLSTQPERPDDPASRYLNTAGNVVGGVVGGGGVNELAGAAPATFGQVGRSIAIATPPALAGRAVAEARPFDEDWKNAAASTLTQALGTVGLGKALAPQGALLPENQIKNDAVTQGQEAGYQFPPATTNPTGGNTALETIAGKTNVAQNMAINNQAVTNEGARADMGLPPGKGGAITDLEIAQAKANAAPGYNALRNTGPINPPPGFGAALDKAMSAQSGAGRLSAKLADPELADIVSDIKQKANAGPGAFDAGDAIDAISALRDKASAAYRAGNSQAGKAYKGVATEIEGAIDSDLSSRGPATASLVDNFRDSRTKFAIINSVDENRNATTGNVLAPKLAAALKSGDYLSGNLKVAGMAAGQAEKSGAFAEPTKTAGNHLGVAGALLGGGALAEMMPESIKSMGLGGLALAAAYPAGRWITRQYVQGPGQSNALPRAPGPMTNAQILSGALASGAAGSNR